MGPPLGDADLWPGLAGPQAHVKCESCITSYACFPCESAFPVSNAVSHEICSLPIDCAVFLSW